MRLLAAEPATTGAKKPVVAGGAGLEAPTVAVGAQVGDRAGAEAHGW